MIKLYDVGMEPVVTSGKSNGDLSETNHKIPARLDFNTIKNLLFLVEHPDSSDPDKRMAA
ncbi:MAG: hypothetical protein QHI38_08785 [Armatimonadota bacterium]|nr:hypothetical protein [Armatimonadota bacterium]